MVSSVLTRQRQELTELKGMVSMLGSQQEQMRSEMAELKAFLVEQGRLGHLARCHQGQGQGGR